MLEKQNYNETNENIKNNEVERANPENIEFDKTLNALKEKEYQNMLNDIKENPTSSLRIEKNGNGVDVISFIVNGLPRHLTIGNDKTPTLYSEWHSDGTVSHKLIRTKEEFYDVMEKIKKVYDQTAKERAQTVELHKLNDKLLKFKDGEGEFIQRVNEEYKDMLDDIKENGTYDLKYTKDKNGREMIIFKNSDKDIQYENKLYLGDESTRPICIRIGRTNDSLGRSLGSRTQAITNEGEYRKVMEEIKKVYDQTAKERAQTAELHKLSDKLLKFKEGEGEFVQRLNEEYKDMFDDIKENGIYDLKYTKDENGREMIVFQNSDKDVRFENRLYLGDGSTCPIYLRIGRSNDSFGRLLGSTTQALKNEGEYKKVLEEIKKVYDKTAKERAQTAKLHKLRGHFASISYKPSFKI